MRVLCRHGHIAFFPRYEYEIFIYNDMFDASLERCGDYYTFPLLAEAPDFSLIGKSYLGLPALVRYEGNPWEIMRENGFVYNITLGTLVPKALITSSVNPKICGEYSVINGAIIQPGSINFIGQKILSYDAEFLQENMELRIIEYSYE
jgi:hypothetical protein